MGEYLSTLSRRGIIRPFLAAVVAVFVLSLEISSRAAAEPAGVRPCFELAKGETFFRLDGRPSFVLGRNPAGTQASEFAEHFRHTKAAGERFVRIHFTHMPADEHPGVVDPRMLNGWEQMLDAAQASGLGVLPVLGVWADWNDGSHGETWHRWDHNPYSVVLDGPAQAPSELFDDTPCRRLWLERLASLVRRWATRPAIVGWEIFSELDLVTGATEGRAVKFVERAAAVIRTSDPAKRPVMASQAGVHEWPKLLASPALDVIQIHPYAAGPYGGKLDELILKSVRDRLRTYGKPVLIGESGLDHAPPRGTLDASPRAEIGIRHAIWAALVSGAMNGRALWWQDGYDIFEKVALTSRYERAAAGAAAFARHVDYSGFSPVASQLSTNLFGAALGSRRQVIVWVRDAACQPPEWPIRTLSGEQVMLDAANGAWEVEIFDPETGQSTGHANLTATTGKLRVPLPEFRGAVALKAVNID